MVAEEEGSSVGSQELEELQELMERVGKPDEKIEKLIKAASADPEILSDLREAYRVKAGQVATKDEFYHYEDLDGEFKIGEDSEGNSLGLIREQLNEHLLTVSMTGRGRPPFTTT